MFHHLSSPVVPAHFHGRVFEGWTLEHSPNDMERGALSAMKSKSINVHQCFPSTESPSLVILRVIQHSMPSHGNGPLEHISIVLRGALDLWSPCHVVVGSTLCRMGDYRSSAIGSKQQRWTYNSGVGPPSPLPCGVATMGLALGSS